jgi:hypothetical protein
MSSWELIELSTISKGSTKIFQNWLRFIIASLFTWVEVVEVGYSDIERQLT